MSSRTLWLVVFSLCLIALTVSAVYAYRAPAGQLLPFLLAVPIVLLARIAWRRFHRAV